MNKKQYEEKRKALLAENDALIEAGKFEEHEAKLQEVKNLDEQWEKTTTAMANTKALQDNFKITDLENKSQSVEGGTVVEKTNDVTNVLSDEEVYKNAWAKHMLGQAIEGKELEVFNTRNKEFNNAYTHTTGNSAVLIPETVVAGIWSRAEEMYPLFADARKFNVRGTLKIAKHDSIEAGDAAWYAEGTPTVDEENAFGEMILDGHELAKLVRVSWKLKAMAVQDFIAYIINELGERVGVALGTAAARGNGTTQPEGVETALLAEAGTPQVVNGVADYANITEAISKVHSSYLNGAKFYVNNATIYGAGGLINVLDGNNRPYFTEDALGTYSGRMFGFPVVADAGVSPGAIIFGNASKGLVFNTNEPFSVTSDDDVAKRESLYAAYAVIDGGVLDNKAFALIDGVVPTP